MYWEWFNMWSLLLREIHLILMSFLRFYGSAKKKKEIFDYDKVLQTTTTSLTKMLSINSLKPVTHKHILKLTFIHKKKNQNSKPQWTAVTVIMMRLIIPIWCRRWKSNLVLIIFPCRSFFCFFWRPMHHNAFGNK